MSSVRFLVNAIASQIVASDDIVVYRRTDGLDVDWLIPGSVPAGKPVTFVNESAVPINVNVMVSSSIFYDGAAGIVPTIIVQPGQSVSWVFNSQNLWYVVAKHV